jgi:hypothetical protein
MESEEYYDSKLVSRVIELCRLLMSTTVTVTTHCQRLLYKFVSKRSTIKGTYFVTEVDLRICLSLYCSDATQTSKLPLTTHALQSLQLWFKTVNNKRQFTLEAEALFRP